MCWIGNYGKASECWWSKDSSHSPCIHWFIQAAAVGHDGCSHTHTGIGIPMAGGYTFPKTEWVRIPMGFGPRCIPKMSHVYNIHKWHSVNTGQCEVGKYKIYFPISYMKYVGRHPHSMWSNMRAERISLWREETATCWQTSLTIEPEGHFHQNRVQVYLYNIDWAVACNI